MTNDLLTKLIEDPLVYYIYQIDESIYGIEPESPLFRIIVAEDFQLDKNFKKCRKYHERIQRFAYDLVYDNCTFLINTVEEWFAKINNCEIECWECACLNKKFVYKEHVKLLMQTDAYKLGMNYRLKYTVIPPTFNYYWNAFKDLKFTLQILENHKIVNFKEVAAGYQSLKLAKDDEELLLKIYSQLTNNDLKLLHKAVDGVIQKRTLDKIKQVKKC